MKSDTKTVIYTVLLGIISVVSGSVGVLAFIMELKILGLGLVLSGIVFFG